MGCRINRAAFEQLIEGNLEWLLNQPRTLERDHIEQILRHCAKVYYPPMPSDTPEVQLSQSTETLLAYCEQCDAMTPHVELFTNTAKCRRCGRVLDGVSIPGLPGNG